MDREWNKLHSEEEKKNMLNRAESLSLWLFLFENYKYKHKTLGPMYIVLILFSVITTPLDIPLWYETEP